MALERTEVPIFKACELAGVSQSTMFEWIAAGRVEFVRSRGGSMLIVVDTLSRASNRRRRSTSTNRSPHR
jgi:excisionase family DNA binding protein